MTQAKILIVDDEGIISMETQQRLEQLGYSVIGVAGSGEEAVEQADGARPDLVLMDIRMPGKVDGIEAARKLREQFEIPVVYVTAYGDKETIERVKITQPFGYIVKPFDDRDLYVAIEIALANSRIEKELRQTMRHIIGLNTLCVQQLEEQAPMIEAMRNVHHQLRAISQEASGLAEHIESLLSRSQGLDSSSQKDNE